jgi:hypothetical protein
VGRLPEPGQYRPDPTQGITRGKDLNQPIVTRRSRNDRRRPCPRCGHSAFRDRVFQRTFHDLGGLVSGQTCGLILADSQTLCSKGRRYFNADCTDLVAPGSHDTKCVVATALRRVVEDGLPYQAAS